MKIVTITALLIFLTLSCGNSNITKNQIILKAELLGRYRLTQDYILNLDEYSNGSYYFLVEITLLNNTKTDLEFWSNSCSAGANIILISDEITLCVNDCSSNFVRRIKLEPDQKFIIPVILMGTLPNYQDIKFGYFIAPAEKIDLIKYDEIVRKKTEQLQNIIWSNPINLSIGDEPFRIE